MPIHDHLGFGKRCHAAPLLYGVLIHVSTGYPPAEDRLHTRYAPVRRSLPALLREMPLDLHVLGLPLAFILSQDQTLHSIISFQPPLPRL